MMSRTQELNKWLVNAEWYEKGELCHTKVAKWLIDDAEAEIERLKARLVAENPDADEATEFVLAVINQDLRAEIERLQAEVERLKALLDRVHGSASRHDRA